MYIRVTVVLGDEHNTVQT